LRNTSVFVCGLNDGTRNNIHNFEEEEEFVKKGYALKFNRNKAKSKSIYIQDIKEFRETAETYMKVNEFSTCFLPEHLINDPTTKVLIQSLLPSGKKHKKALVGYSYLNHLKTFGFNDKQIQDLGIEDHEEHDNTIFLVNGQKNVIYYIRITSQQEFKCKRLAIELKRCNDFLKSFLLLHEAKVEGEHITVCAMVAFTNISSFSHTQYEDLNDLKPFIVYKDDIANKEKLYGKLNRSCKEVQDILKNRGVMSKTPAAIHPKLLQILSESMATMVLVNIALPRLSKDPFDQVVSLLLNREQYEIIHHPDQHSIITGGYGCGKTLVLLEIAKKLFLRIETGNIFYICFDPYSLLPARMKKYFKELKSMYPNRNGVNLASIGINQSDDDLGENKRDLTSILEFYTNQSRESTHFLIDEVDGEKFIKQYAKSVEKILQEKRLAQSKVVFAMQSMGRQRIVENVDSTGHCFRQTGMTLLTLTKSMRMAGNIFTLKRIATDSILQRTTLLVKEPSSRERKKGVTQRHTTKQANSVFQRQQSNPEPKDNAEINTIQKKVIKKHSFEDIDYERFKLMHPELFSDAVDSSSTKIQTDYTYPEMCNGVKVKGHKLPSIFNLNKSFDLNLGKSGIILSQILKDLLKENLKTCILCNTQEEACLTKYSLERLQPEWDDDDIYLSFTPCLDGRLPDDEEKEIVWEKSQTSSSVLVTDHKGFRGCEAERIVAFVNQDDEHNNHVLVEILTRAVVNLCLLVLPCKSGDANIKEGSLRHVIQLWKEENAVSEFDIYLEESEHEIEVKSNIPEFQPTRYSNAIIDFAGTQYEEFKMHINRIPQEVIIR